jgi:hypothetical protein
MSKFQTFEEFLNESVIVAKAANDLEKVVDGLVGYLKKLPETKHVYKGVFTDYYSPKWLEKHMSKMVFEPDNMLSLDKTKDENLSRSVNLTVLTKKDQIIQIIFNQQGSDSFTFTTISKDPIPKEYVLPLTVEKLYKEKKIYKAKVENSGKEEDLQFEVGKLLNYDRENKTWEKTWKKNPIRKGYCIIHRYELESAISSEITREDVKNLKEYKRLMEMNIKDVSTPRQIKNGSFQFGFPKDYSIPPIPDERASDQYTFTKSGYVRSTLVPAPFGHQPSVIGKFNATSLEGYSKALDIVIKAFERDFKALEKKGSIVVNSPEKLKKYKWAIEASGYDLF